MINFHRTYRLGEGYDRAKERAEQMLGRYLKYPELFLFDDANRSITFLSERLIPEVTTGRPRVMLLFSNPHPLSIHQGMFLSPNSRGQESLFWQIMKCAGWLCVEGQNLAPKQLAQMCLKVEYLGPFELIFHCYYAFPTDFPEDIRKIFGKEYFQQVLEPEARHEFRRTVQETSVDAVVVFNKGIFNLVSEEPIDRYIERLLDGEMIQSQISGTDHPVPIFLTFPTGWRYHKESMQIRTDSLVMIRKAICQLLNIAVNGNT